MCLERTFDESLRAPGGRQIKPDDSNRAEDQTRYDGPPESPVPHAGAERVRILAYR
jgi:hypothetical protein